MTEDEAFIRAIVDHPGDDTPRLVYADWLDENGDSRGKYLRAELEWAVGQVSPIKIGQPWTLPVQLEQLAGGLNPLWVSRVSRPPIGVCCDRIRFSPRGLPITSEDVALAEKKLRLSFPSEYQAFLLNYNGGFPDPFEFQDSESLYRIDSFNQIRWDDEGDAPYSDSVVGMTILLRGGFSRAPAGTFKSYIHIGSDPCPNTSGRNFYFLRVTGKNRGRIHVSAIDYEPDPRLVANSLPILLSSLYHDSPIWHRLIYRGDLPGLNNWLDDGGSLEVREESDRATGISLLDRAASYRQEEIALMLLRRGARISDTFWIREWPHYLTSDWLRRIERIYLSGQDSGN